MTQKRMSGTLVRSTDEAWRALKVPGVSIKVLRNDKTTGETTALIKFAAGARFPAHNHPGGEEVFVVDGDLTIGSDTLKAGDFCYTPPNGKHSASSDGGCVFLVTTPKPIEIIE